MRVPREQVRSHSRVRRCGLLEVIESWGDLQGWHGVRMGWSAFCLERMKGRE
jgi:hypothetical protein